MKGKYSVIDETNSENIDETIRKFEENMLAINYSFNFNKFPEPLVTAYPDSRGGWSAKNVHKGDELYDARFYFPESWRGLVGEELEKVCGVKGAKFCHKSGFLCVNETKEGLLKMVELGMKNVK